MTSLINFELVSPEKKLVSEPVHMAVIPGDEGMFGVLHGHCSLLASLKPGVLKIYKTQGGDITRIFIAGGFADVSAEKCVVLAEEAINVRELNADKIHAELKDLAEDLEMAVEKTDKVRIKNKIGILNAKLQAIAA